MKWQKLLFCTRESFVSRKDALIIRSNDTATDDDDDDDVDEDETTANGDLSQS